MADAPKIILNRNDFCLSPKEDHEGSKDGASHTVNVNLIFLWSQSPPSQPETYNADVPKLVCRGHGVIIQQTGCGHPARICVISKDDELVLVASVPNPEQALLNVRYNHSLAYGVDASDQVGNVLKRRAMK